MSKAEPTIEKFMTTQPYFIAPTASFFEAESMMKNHKIRHLPVVKAGKIVGVVSDRDVKMVKGFENAEQAHISVADVCASNPYTVEPDTTLRETVETMASKHYGCAVVMQNGKLVGIFTTIDACRALAVILQTRYHECGGRR